eukprot:1899672-Prymnesium_polylepis.2
MRGSEYSSTVVSRARLCAADTATSPVCYQASRAVSGGQQPDGTVSHMGSGSSRSSGSRPSRLNLRQVAIAMQSQAHIMQHVQVAGQAQPRATSTMPVATLIPTATSTMPIVSPALPSATSTMPVATPVIADTDSNLHDAHCKTSAAKRDLGRAANDCTTF